MEYDHVVDSVEELRTEMLLELLLNLALHLFIGGYFIVVWGKAKILPL